MRMIKKIVNVNVIGINALKDLDTESGTPGGILIVQFFFTKNRYSSAEINAVNIPKNIPCAPRIAVGITLLLPLILVDLR